MPYLSVLADFRNNVRSHARELKASKILGECDKLRDDILPNVGVRLEDHDGKQTLCEYAVTVGCFG
jgi:cysteinyl-tRNA synthetase